MRRSRRRICPEALESKLMARKGGRTQTCGEPQARQRLDHARRFLEVAELTADVTDPSLEYGSVAASVASLPDRSRRRCLLQGAWETISL